MPVLHQGAWRKDSPFGRCPSCNELGIEERPSASSEWANFRCSSDSCKTNYPPLLNSSDILKRLGGIRRTRWTEKKPRWWQLKRLNGEVYSWNDDKFPEADLIKEES